MEALDRESFEFRAAFLGRPMEVDLVGSLEGHRGAEARARLEEIAAQRRTNLDRLIAEIRGRADAEENEEDDGAEEPPTRVFDGDACPVCFASSDLFALACGHVLCATCHDEIKVRCQARCPTCRRRASTRFPLSENSTQSQPVLSCACL